ncbi:MAG TPA: ATP-binding protein [Thermoanaerobaculia bacterium]|jgi:two-component system sensor histidine kinase ChvG|nr:ATP-binding protein [Thermoanaerobaculia bacterium]
MRFLARISIRLLLFNVLLVFLPAAGFFYLDVYEKELLEAQERAMVQQGRLAAAALSKGSGGGQSPGIDAEAAVRLLARLQGRTEMRLRVVDLQGRLLADSAHLIPPRPAPVIDRRSRYFESRALSPEARQTWLYRLGAWLYRLPGRFAGAFGPPEPPSGAETFYMDGQPLLGREIKAALDGRYGATVRPTRGGPRSLTLYSALPVRDGDHIAGAVLVSQSTYRILRALYDVRLDVFKVVLLSVAVAAILSLLVSTTIARPLEALRNEANDLLDRRGRLKGKFRGSQKHDEIGDLARALEQLTARLEGHLRFIEAFASDVSHELKNPLASIRTATEMLAEVDDPADRERFLAVTQREVARMEHLLSAMREITEIDARLDALSPDTAPPVDLRELLPQIVDGFRLRAPEGVGIILHEPGTPVRVAAAPERLDQIFGNLLDNALSFAPPGTAVEVDLIPGAFVTIADRGPGIPPDHLHRLFDRFFTWRPESASLNGHTGLGLAIVKAIAEGYGGGVTARNRSEGGAVFEVKLPELLGD